MPILYIKNMVCARCIRIVERLFVEAGILTKNVQLGEVEPTSMPTAEQLISLKRSLATEGFELLDDRSSRLVEQIKILIIDEIHHAASRRAAAMNFSEFLARETLCEYSQLSKLFSAVEGLTIEKFIIAQKIERAKELLLYNEMTLAEIAYEMGYSSSQHLSNQFRQVTGLTPTTFKTERRAHGRKPLDKV